VTEATRARLPLAGVTVVDLSNVVAGPACGRAFVELAITLASVTWGASIARVGQLGQHSSHSVRRKPHPAASTTMYGGVSRRAALVLDALR